jgi:DNA-binding CsgD family transcriptional regulator
MAGKKGMKQFGDTIIEEVLAMRTAGKTNKEIGEYFNLTGY